MNESDETNINNDKNEIVDKKEDLYVHVKKEFLIIKQKKEKVEEKQQLELEIQTEKNKRKLDSNNNDNTSKEALKGKKRHQDK
jgi:hypothetical protein